MSENSEGRCVCCTVRFTKTEKDQTYCTSCRRSGTIGGAAIENFWAAIQTIVKDAIGANVANGSCPQCEELDATFKRQIKLREDEVDRLREIIATRTYADMVLEASDEEILDALGEEALKAKSEVGRAIIQNALNEVKARATASTNEKAPSPGVAAEYDRRVAEDTLRAITEGGRVPPVPWIERNARNVLKLLDALDGSRRRSERLQGELDGITTKYFAECEARVNSNKLRDEVIERLRKEKEDR